MKQLTAPDKQSELLKAGYVLTILGSALVEWYVNGVKKGPVPVSNSQPLGPFDSDMTIMISALAGKISYDFVLDSNRFSPNIPANNVGSRKPYLGPVSNRNGLNESGILNGTASMCRTAHIAYEDLIFWRVAYDNFCMSGGLDRTSSAPATLMVTVEYPLGTFTDFVFAGDQLGIQPVNGRLYSDFINVYVPKGAMFWLSPMWSCPGNTGYMPMANRLCNVDAREGFTAVVGADHRKDGYVYNPTAVRTIQQSLYRPGAIEQYTTAPSVFMFGDSIAVGWGTITLGAGDILDETMCLGLERLMPCGFVNAALGGDAVFTALNNYTNRSKFVGNCTHGFGSFGTNDIDTSNAPLTTVNNLNLLKKNFFPNLPTALCTQLPRVASSSDGFQVPANQVARPNETNRQIFNAMLLAGFRLNSGVNAGPSLVDYVFDLASIMEDPTTKKWRASNLQIGSQFSTVNAGNTCYWATGDSNNIMLGMGITDAAGGKIGNGGYTYITALDSALTGIFTAAHTNLAAGNITLTSFYADSNDGIHPTPLGYKFIAANVPITNFIK